MKMLSIKVLYACLMSLTCAVSITANMLLLLILGFNRKLQKDTSVLTFNLCICDLMLGLAVIPGGVHNALSNGDCYSRKELWCQFFAFLYTLLQLASVHSMTWVTVDKFAEICLPLHYVQLFTRQRAWVIIFSIWIYCILNASLPFVGLGQYTYVEHKYICAPTFSPSLKAYCLVTIAIGVLLPLMIVCCLAVYIVQIARHQTLRGTYECNDQHCYTVPAKRYLRSTIALISIAFLLLICWMPHITISMYETFEGKPPPLAEMLSTWLAFLTSALNPLTNSVPQKKYRNEIRESWRNLKRRVLHKEKCPLSSAKEASVSFRSQEI